MLNATQFKFHLARYAKVKEDVADSFMNAVSKVLLEKLKSGEEVSIQGLGTFSIVQTQQGRRLAFQVDEKMRSQVNAPFACFEPMTLASKPESSIVGPEAEPSVEEAADVVSEPAVEEVPEPTSSDEVTPTTEEEAESAPETPVVEQETEQVPEEEASVQEEESPVAMEPKPEESPVAIESKPEESPVAMEPKPEESVPVEEKKEEKKDEKAPKVEKKVTAASKKKVEEEPIWKKPQTIGMIAAGVVVVIILLVVLLRGCGSSEKKTSTKAAVEQVAVPAAPAEAATEEVAPVEEKTADKPVEVKPVSKPKTKPSSSAALVASSPFTSDEKPSPEMILHENGKPKLVALEEGERLTLLALRCFGDKSFWAYIYDVNAYQLGDPNNVPTGRKLYLPDPTYFNIDDSNPSSIKRAQNRAMQILQNPASEGAWGRR